MLSESFLPSIGMLICRRRNFADIRKAAVFSTGDDHCSNGKIASSRKSVSKPLLSREVLGRSQIFRCIQISLRYPCVCRVSQPAMHVAQMSVLLIAGMPSRCRRMLLARQLTSPASVLSVHNAKAGVPDLYPAQTDRYGTDIFSSLKLFRGLYNCITI